METSFPGDRQEIIVTTRFAGNQSKHRQCCSYTSLYNDTVKQKRVYDLFKEQNKTMKEYTVR